MGALPLAADFASFCDVKPINPEFRCIYYLVKEGRCCKNVIANRLVETTADIKKRILSETSSQKKSALLREFIENCCCKRYHRKEVTGTPLAEELLRRWENELGPLTSVPAISSKKAPQPQHGYALRSKGSVPGPTASSLGRKEGAPTERFEPMRKKSSETLVKMLRRPLSHTDNWTFGDIYAFGREFSPGMIKIGYSRNTEKRMKDIRRKCKYEPILAHRIRNVPHNTRAERLIHYDLLPYWRRELICNNGLGCETRHREWFECSLKLATRSMDNISKWLIEAEPYDADGFLKPEWEKFIEETERAGREVTSQSLLDEWERLQQLTHAPCASKAKDATSTSKAVVSQEAETTTTYQPVTTLGQDIEERISNIVGTIESLRLDLLLLKKEAKLTPTSQFVWRKVLAL